MTSNCYNNNYDNLYVKPFEVCNFKALSRLTEINSGKFPLDIKDSNSIFSSNFLYLNQDLNKDIRDSNNNKYIYNYNYLKKDLCYSPNNNSNFNVNCVIATKNPFYTYNKKKKTCSLIPNLELPKNFSYMYENDNTYIYKEDDENSLKINYATKIDKAYCENKWYDWIVVPNYHFGNQYEKDEGIYSKEDVRRCYKPCGKGYLPYTALNGSNICILKENALDGLYNKKLDYSPISLINLIGNTKEDDLKKLFKLIRTIELLNYNNSNSDYAIKPDIKLATFDKDEYISNEINNLYDEIKNVVVNNILDENNFNIDNYQYNKKILTYNNPNFNEDEPELLTYRGMSKANMLTDAILFHTFYIADKYSKFINNIIDNIHKEIGGFISANTHSSKIKYDHNKEILNNEENLILNIKEILKDKIKYEENKEQYYQRIANIFYKAINICYNNTNDFSKNILIKTKEIIYIFKNNDNYKTIIKNIYYNDKNNEELNEILNNLYEKQEIKIRFYNNDEFERLKISTGFDIESTNLDVKISQTNPYYSGLFEKSGLEEYKQQKTNINDIEKNVSSIIKVRNNIVFFTTELNEIPNNNCSINQIWNSDKKICEPCESLCSTNKDNNTCITNDRCKLFCKDICKIKEKKNVTKCGKIMKDKNSEKENININDIDTPLDESNIPTMDNITYALRIAVKVFFYAIILYLCYIFYQLYGETLFTIANLILYYSTFIFYFIYYLFSDNPLKYKYAFDEYKKRNAINKYERLVTKANSINP